MGLGRRGCALGGTCPAACAATLFEDGEHRNDPNVSLPAMAIGEEVTYDYANLRLSLKPTRWHCCARNWLSPASHRTNGWRTPRTGRVSPSQESRWSGNAPGTASGVIFITLEDETAVANIVVWPKTFERYRQVVMGARLIRVTGKLQREGIVVHVIADHLEDLNHRLHALGGPDFETRHARKSADSAYENNLARADEVEIHRRVPADLPPRRCFPSRDFH